MVARTPPSKERRRALAELNPNLVRETLKKVDICMARLQELQYTVTGGSKVVSGVSLSPRSTRGYLRTSLRCKQETVRIKGTPVRKSPVGKFQGCMNADWRRTSLPAMLLGETVVEILQASQFAKQVVNTANNLSKTRISAPKTPNQIRRNPNFNNPNHTPLRARRTKEKQNQSRTNRFESGSPPNRQTRAKSRIQFKSISPNRRPSVSANRVSPKNRPWAKKTVLFPNPTFIPSSSAHSSSSPVANANSQQRFYKTRSPIISRSNKPITPPHKFVIKSPGKSLGTQFGYQKAIPVAIAKSPVQRGAAKQSQSRRCSFSPVKLASRLVSPFRARVSLRKSCDGPINGPKQRPNFSSPLRIVK